MNREEALKLAKHVYEMRENLIKELNKEYPKIGINVCWDDCIGVDGYLFHGHELRGEDE